LRRWNISSSVCRTRENVRNRNLRWAAAGLLAGVAALDGTGTLTCGAPQLIPAWSVIERCVNQPLAHKQFIEHPPGRAIVEEARTRGVPIPHGYRGTSRRLAALRQL